MSAEHSHSHGTPSYNRAFALGILLNLVFVAIEGGFGLWLNSLALLADAGHNLSDVVGLLLAWGANYLSGRPASARRTFGWLRTSILAALLNGVLLLVAVGGIFWEAIQRFSQPQPVSGTIVMGVAGVGIVINLLTAMLFFSGRKNDLNIRGAFLHMMADAAVSLAVVIAGLLIYLTDLLWFDPAVSLLIGSVIAIGTWGLFRESLNLTLDAVPSVIDPEKVHSFLVNLPGITAVQHIHIWGLSTTQVAMTAQLVKPDGLIDDTLTDRIAEDCLERFKIVHVTIQYRQVGEQVCNLFQKNEHSEEHHHEPK